MKIIRHGKCAKCRRPTSEKREFVQSVDMFNPQPKETLSGELLQEIRAWRKTKLFCEAHRNE